MATKKIVKKRPELLAIFDTRLSSGDPVIIGNPAKKTHWISTTVQYIILAAIVVLCFRGCDYHLQFPKLTMSWYMVVPIALSLAYVWVDVFKIGVVKPFNCISCMAGWFSLIIAFAFHVPLWFFYASIGTFTGAIYSSIRMRWL